MGRAGGGGVRWHQMPGMGKRKVELALEILLGDLEILQGHMGALVTEEDLEITQEDLQREILQGHMGALVTEELYNRRKADALAQHLSPVCVSKLVRDDAGGNTDRGHDILQCSAQPAS